MFNQFYLGRAKWSVNAETGGKTRNRAGPWTVYRYVQSAKTGCVESMANIAGYRAIVEAAQYFGAFFYRPNLPPRVKYPPAKVLVIRAGVAVLRPFGAGKRHGCNCPVLWYPPRKWKNQIGKYGMPEFLMLDFKGKKAGGTAVMPKPCPKNSLTPRWHYLLSKRRKSIYCHDRTHSRQASAKINHQSPWLNRWNPQCDCGFGGWTRRQLRTDWKRPGCGKHDVTLIVFIPIYPAG